MEIEEFGLPDVDSAADLTAIQSVFLRIARDEREQHRKRRSKHG